MCTEFIHVVDPGYPPTTVFMSQQRPSYSNLLNTVSTTVALSTHYDRKFSTTSSATLTNDLMPLESAQRVASLPTPKGSPRTSTDSIKLAESEPIFTQKLPDDFFTASSPPSPIAPIIFSLLALQNNTSINSPHIHPTTSSTTYPPVEPTKKSATTITKKDDILLPPPTTCSIPNQYNLTHDDTHYKTHQLSLDDFVLKQTLGTGSSARVHLAKSRVTNKYYAIKAINKKDLVSGRQVEHAHNEREILDFVSHPFMVKLWDTFQSDSHVFLVLDYVPGGELFREIRKNKKLTEDAARFYAAEVLLAIEYLHSQHIVFRDLKPENILIDHDGHVKLTDFGFAKRLPNDFTWTVCGTPDYLAPEIIRSQGYTKAVDWWSLGILIFEMITGHPPFTAKNPIDQYQKILLGDIEWSEQDMSPEAKDLLENLLKTKPSERFGNLKDGANDIKHHAWFQSIDFDQVVANRHLIPPFVPELKSAEDTNCFDYYEEMSSHYDMAQTNDDHNYTHFSGF